VVITQVGKKDNIYTLADENHGHSLKVIDVSDLNNIQVISLFNSDVDPNSKIAQEEIFGPVLVVIGVDNIKEAISIANNSKYGLAASIWTNDLDEAYQVSKALEAGIVHINSYGDDDNMAPFGGIKESGLGKDKSIYAFDEYSELKTIWVNLKSL
jgi:acyl-CoA reductase-like NAD-dependent aldehyde dehydrogenase